MDSMWRRSREERVHSLINEPVEVLRERESISLDDTILQTTDWERLLNKLARCRGDERASSQHSPSALSHCLDHGTRTHLVCSIRSPV